MPRYNVLFGLTPPEWVSVETDADLVALWGEVQALAEKGQTKVCMGDGVGLALIQVVAVVRDDKGGRTERPER